MPKVRVALRPHDVCVALQLCVTPEVAFRALAQSVGLSLGEAHNATQRLREARLVFPDRSAIQRPALLEFLTHGVPYAFPAHLGPEVRGVPTAHAGPLLAEHIGGAPVVWSHSTGSVRGASIIPLCASAPEAASVNPELYDLLTLVDALRVGRARERSKARELLESVLLAPDA